MSSSSNIVAVTSSALDMLDCIVERKSVARLEVLCKEVAAAPRVVDALHVAAHRAGISYSSMRRWYYSWKIHGTDGLIDQRKVRKLKRENPWLECYMTYCERHNRSNKGGWRAMMDDFADGQVLPHGVGDWRDQWRATYKHRSVPDRQPIGWYPPAARYENLQRAAKSNPHYMFQMAASRKGRKAAHEFLLPVLRTRIGLAPGQVFEADDLHIDVEIVMPGIDKIARPQKFVIYDLASGFQTASAMRPQYPEVKGGRRNSLKEREFRMLLAYQLTGVGFHREGCRVVVEHGTTAVRETLERRIKSIPRFGGLITFERSGILAEAVHAGFFKGDGGGNFRLKAYCEQAHRLEHSARAMLPGQIGQDHIHRPESHTALVRYDQMMMDAVATLPADMRDLIRYSLCDWQTFSRLDAALTDKIYDRTDHQLEGWANNRITVWRLNDTDQWKPISELEDIAEPERSTIMTYLKTQPGLVQNRAMSRREAWQAGQRNLTRIPLIELPLLLDDRPINKGGDARQVTVQKDGTFAFRDAFYYGPDDVVHHATCKTRSGFTQALIPGQKYLFFATPFHPDGVIVEPSSGAVIGIAPNYKRAPVYDRDAIIHAAGAQNADLARKLMPIRGRHQAEAEQRLTMIGHNTDVLVGRVSKPKLSKTNPSGSFDDLYEHMSEPEMGSECDLAAVAAESEQLF